MLGQVDGNNDDSSGNGQRSGSSRTPMSHSTNFSSIGLCRPSSRNPLSNITNSNIPGMEFQLFHFF